MKAGELSDLLMQVCTAPDAQAPQLSLLAGPVKPRHECATCLDARLQELTSILVHGRTATGAFTPQLSLLANAPCCCLEAARAHECMRCLEAARDNLHWPAAAARVLSWGAGTLDDHTADSGWLAVRRQAPELLPVLHACTHLIGACTRDNHSRHHA